MKQIRKRPRLDQLLNQQRAGSPALGRRVYLGLLGALGLGVANYLIGDAFILRADGILLADRQAVDAAFPARVASVKVREGDAVAPGDLLMTLESSEIQREIADLSARNAELSMREAQLRGEQARGASLLPLAQRWAHDASASVVRFDAIAAKGLISSESQNRALSQRFDSAAKRAELEGQAQVLESEVPQVIQAHAQSQAALQRLTALYDDGAVRAGAAAIVGPHVPVAGHVAKTGDELMLLYGAQPYVLAYLPSLYLFSVSPGDRVSVDGGPGTPALAGVVESILGVADALPPEFQSAYRPRDRDRLMRIRLSGAQGLALSQKVGIGGCALGWCWRGRADLAKDAVAAGG